MQDLVFAKHNQKYILFRNGVLALPYILG